MEHYSFFYSHLSYDSSHRQSFTSIDRITLAIQSRLSIVHAKPSQSRNFPLVQRSGDGIVMPACYSGQFQQITPIAATTSDSIGGNAAMSAMPAYYTTSVTQTTLYNQAGTIYGASGNIGQPSGYGIPMSGYYQMPQDRSTVNRQYSSGMFYGQQPVVYPSVAQATAYSSFPRTHEQMSIWSVWNEWYGQSRSYVLRNNDEYPPHQT
ncbi:hypothetical protein QQG55_8530 [Brugia pahangi]